MACCTCQAEVVAPYRLRVSKSAMPGIKLSGLTGLFASVSWNKRMVRRGTALRPPGLGIGSRKPCHASDAHKEVHVIVHSPLCQIICSGQFNQPTPTMCDWRATPHYSELQTGLLCVSVLQGGTHQGCHTSIRGPELIANCGR